MAAVVEASPANNNHAAEPKQTNGHHHHRGHHVKSHRPPKKVNHDLGVSIGIEHVYEVSYFIHLILFPSLFSLLCFGFVSQPFPMAVRKTEARGRIVVATRDIKAGDFVLRSIHYTTTVRCDSSVFDSVHSVFTSTNELDRFENYLSHTEYLF